MLFRAIALSLALLIGMTTVIPFFTNSAEAIPRNVKKKRKQLKKYSKVWWRWYHQQKRKKRAALARNRALRAKLILLNRKKAKNNTLAQTVEKNETVKPKSATQIEVKPQQIKVAPKIEKESPTSDNGRQFPVNDSNGKSVGTAYLSIFGQAIGEDNDSGVNKKIGGIPTSALRRNVVDKMVKEEGWVVNDYQKAINGKKVYVVVAESSVKGVVQSRVFYFTEVAGKIYSISTTSPNEGQDRIAQESEKIIQLLQRGNSIAQIVKK